MTGLALALALMPHPSFAAEDELPEELAKLDQKQQEDAIRFMTGNVIYVLFHEAGHMLISELNLPVLGREEDAVDTLSAVLLLEADDKELDQALTDSVDSWMSGGEGVELADEDMMDTHSLDKQRAYNIACMMVGKDQARFKDFADRINLPQERRDECVWEYQKSRDSWYSVLGPYLAPDDDKIQFKMAYYKTKNADLVYYRDYLKELGALEIIRDTFSGLVKLKPGIKLSVNVCGEANAYWDSDNRELTYCMEDARSYVQSYATDFVGVTLADDGSAEEDDSSSDDDAEETESAAQ
jgi:hypothetical protein